MNLLGCSVPDSVFQAWSKLLVFPYAPFFLTDGFKVPPYGITLSRTEFSQTFRDLSFHDSYASYNVGKKASSVTLLSSQDLENLPAKVRLKLLRLQTSLGRGQIYNFNEYKNILNLSELKQAQKRVFDFRGKEMLELNHDLWHSFSFATQKRWLAKFVSEDRQDCLSKTLSKPEWQSINEHHPAIKHLVGFADSSGPNCFAITLAAILEVEEARKVSGLWLQAETFLREIKKNGYKKSKRKVNRDLPHSSILVWENNNSTQHACFYLGNHLVLNKDAQVWFAPRQILKLETVIDGWKEFQVSVYVKARA